MGSHSLLQGHLPSQGIEPRSPALQVDSFPCEPPGKPIYLLIINLLILFFHQKNLLKTSERRKWGKAVEAGSQELGLPSLVIPFYQVHELVHLGDGINISSIMQWTTHLYSKVSCWLFASKIVCYKVISLQLWVSYNYNWICVYLTFWAFAPYQVKKPVMKTFLG